MPSGNDERGFIRVVRIASALALGAMAAFLQAMKAVHPSVRFEVSFGTFAAFAVAAVASWVFFGVLFREELAHHAPTTAGAGAGTRTMKRWVIYFSVALAALMVAATARSLQGLSRRKILEVIEGLGAAVLAVGLLLFLFWRVARYLERDSVRGEHKHRAPPPAPPATPE
jgi:hypothetical protein